LKADSVRTIFYALGANPRHRRGVDRRDDHHWLKRDLGEDIAALLGLAFALVAVLLTMLTGNPVWDALGSISIGALLIVVAIGIGIEIKALLIGQNAEPETVECMREDRWL